MEQVRRRWGLRGVRIIQPRQIDFAWRYLVLAVDVIHLDLKWTWAERMNQASLKPIFEQWALETVIWDGASSHRGQDIGTLPMNRIFLPPYSPELNPAERIFEEVRREIEGFIYPSLQAKKIVFINSCNAYGLTKTASLLWSHGIGLLMSSINFLNALTDSLSHDWY